MADLILNEWVWADALGENGIELQKQTFRLLERLASRLDRIVVVRGSSFHQKAWKLCIASSRPSLEMAKFFKLNFLYNSRNCLILDEQSLPPFPSNLGGVNPDDHYLVQAQLAVPGSLIVTTDAPLKTALDGHGIPCELRDAFVNRYLSEG